MANADEKALRAFRRRAAQRSPALEGRFSPTEIGEILAEAETAYAGWLPEIRALPKLLLNGALEGTYELLAYSIVLEKRGLSPREIGDFFDASYRLLVRRYPRFLLKAVFRLARPLLIRKLRKDAETTRTVGAEGTGGWEFDFVEPERGAHAFGIDVTQCAVCSLYARHGQEEVLPYVCALDDTMSEVMDLGLERSGTRAMGASCCDFRYQPGGPGKTLKSIRTFPVLESD